MEQKQGYFASLSRQEQKAALEAIIFSSEESIGWKDLFTLLFTSDSISQLSKSKDEDDESSSILSEEQMTIEDEFASNMDTGEQYFEKLIDEINIELIESGRPFQIVQISGGWQYAVRSEWGELIQRLLKSRTKKRLSQAALETLAIIAYRQPVTKPEIEQIRGVNSGDIVNTLIDRKLVRIAGRKDALGKPLLFSTTDEFLKVFGLNTLTELPRLREFEELAESNPSSNESNFTLSVEAIPEEPEPQPVIEDNIEAEDGEEEN
ncbi:MAG: scpB [Ignavibacteria bacterium]|nr:scpB [Ignavibacteria bacterium]